jgi:heptaprenyl diphosphate synthase
MVLRQSQYREELLDIIEKVNVSLEHSYVKAYVTYPKIDLLQLHFSFLFLKSKGFSIESIQDHCIPQLFIQLGLDIHDQVGIDPLEQEHLIKKRQLTVLSGDFFSSYYYLYLSQRNQVSLIHKWAKVIKEINEMKVDLHQHHSKLPFEQQLRKKSEFQSKLTNAVLSWYDAPIWWFETFTLLTELRMGMNQVQMKDERLESISQQLTQLLNKSENELLISECNLWLESLTQKQLVIKPY